MTPEEFRKRMEEAKGTLPDRYQQLRDEHEALQRRHDQLQRLLATRDATIQKLEGEVAILSKLKTVAENIGVPSGGEESLSPAAPGDAAPPPPERDVSPRRGRGDLHKPKFQLTPPEPPKKKGQHPLAKWIDAACRYLMAVNIAKGMEPDQAKIVPMWDRDMKVLKQPAEILGWKELTRRWVWFALDTDAFVERAKTFTYFAANSDRWKFSPKEPFAAAYPPEAEALKAQAKRMFEELFNPQKEVAHEDPGAGPGAGGVRGSGDRGAPAEDDGDGGGGGRDVGAAPGSAPHGEGQQEAEPATGGRPVGEVAGDLPPPVGAGEHPEA